MFFPILHGKVRCGNATDCISGGNTLRALVASTETDTFALTVCLFQPNVFSTSIAFLNAQRENTFCIG